MTDLRATLEAFKPTIAADYDATVRSLFSRMVRDLGESLKGIHNSWTWAKVYNQTVAQYLIGKPAAIDAERLARGASVYADAVVESWEGKIKAKLGELENATVRRLDGYRFNIEGTRDGRAVRIEQDMIINVSKNGTPYNQWPARIYVDGKFTSEAAYRRMFGAAK